MPIKDMGQYMAAVWDWGFLGPALGRCAVSDLDGIVERGGRFLVLETKRPGVPVPRGQAIMFDAMVAAGMTVIIIWGHANQPTRVQVWGETTIHPTNAEHLRHLVREWFIRAGRAGKQTGGETPPAASPHTQPRKEAHDTRE